MSGSNYEQIIKPYLDSKVDEYLESQGEIDKVASLTLDIPDKQLVANLDSRIEDSISYWNEAKGFNLKTNRQKNIKFYLGRQIDEGQLYRFQIPYVENQLFVATETMVAYLTSQDPNPEVYPASDTDRSKILASDLEKGIRAHGQKVDIHTQIETALRHMLIKNVGLLYLWFDPDYGEHGEIRVTALDPDHVVIDKNARRGDNPAFISITRKDSVEDLCYRFPEQRKAIFEQMGIKYVTQNKMSSIVSWRQVWLTHYDKNGKPQEGCVSYFNDLVLAKYKNPNWLYASPEKNFLDVPLKPIIPFNYINQGEHWIDDTTPLEQASWIQEVLNKRGRQIMENADAANGFLAISSAAMTMDDAENLTGDPNQKIVINDTGRPISEDIMNIQGRELASYVVEDKIDLRNTLHGIMGTPSQFRGDDDDLSETLGTNVMVKNQASGRQDLIVRAVDSAMSKYFNMLVQMMIVHYTEKRFMVTNSDDGDFDYVTVQRDLIERGCSISVKSGSTLPFDKARQEQVALELAKGELIDPLNLYRDLHMDNPQKRYDAWAKWKTDPMALARDALDQLDDTTAYVDYIEILGGDKVPGRDDASKEHILIHRKQMLTDEFMKQKKRIRDNFLAHVAEETMSLQLRTDLDQLSQAAAEVLAPPAPAPGQPPMGQPPMQPPVGAPMPPPGPAPIAGPPPTIGGLFGGPAPAPQQTPMPMGPGTSAI